MRFTGNNYLENYLVINTVSADLCYTVKWKANFISYLNLNDLYIYMIQFIVIEAHNFNTHVSFIIESFYCQIILRNIRYSWSQRNQLCKLMKLIIIEA